MSEIVIPDKRLSSEQFEGGLATVHTASYSARLAAPSSLQCRPQTLKKEPLVQSHTRSVAW